MSRLDIRPFEIQKDGTTLILKPEVSLADGCSIHSDRPPASGDGTPPLQFARFVMKGGTAINLFVEDMPRLSVDIDVVWKDHTTPRERVIAGISETLQTLRQGLEQKGIKVRMRAANTGEETKLFVERENRQVKN